MRRSKLLFCPILSLMSVACGSKSNNNNDPIIITPSFSLSIQWNSPEEISGFSELTTQEKCNALGVSDIAITAYKPDKTVAMETKTSCGEGKNELTLKKGIYNIVLNAENSEKIRYSGETGEVSIKEGDKNDLGIITMEHLYTLGGKVTGLLPGSTLELKNSDDAITVTGTEETEVSFIFSESPTNGTSYKVRVSIQPSHQICTTGNGNGNGNGIISGIDNIDITVTCGNTPLPDTGQKNSYTNMPGEDSDYLINPPSYLINENTVSDEITGLMWQQEDDNIKKSWDEAVTYCSDLELGGFTDWNLPKIHELITILDLEKSTPAIDTTIFPNTKSSLYWPLSENALNPDQAWYVYFYNGEIFNADKSNSANYARCVRVHEASPFSHPIDAENFTDNSNQTVTDNKTGFMWQQEEAGTMTWKAGLAYCEILLLADYDDWRLPNYKELQSLVDYSGSPSLDTTYFPNAVLTDLSSYWSSTTNINSSDSSWSIIFFQGIIGSSNKELNNFVKCVRGG